MRSETRLRTLCARRAFALACLPALGGTADPAAATQSAIVPVRAVAVQEDGRVSVRATGQTLEEVLAELAQAAGIALTLRGDLSEPVVQAFGPVPLGEGIRRLVGEHTLLMVEVGPGAESGAPAVTQLLVTGPGGAPGARDAFGNEGDALVRALATGNPAHRIRVIERLAEGGTADAADVLGGVLADDGDARVRIAAAAGLVEIGDDAAVGQLERGLNDSDPVVREAVLRGLGRVGSEPALLLLGQVVYGSAEARARLAAVRALADIGTEPATAMLNAAASDSDEQVRAAARHALFRKR